MSKHEDADLILKLYDLRREATMREARNWLFSFNPDRKSTRLNSSHIQKSRMPSSA